MRVEKIAAKYMGAAPTCMCTQLGHLTDLLNNKVNSQQNFSWDEVWKPKCAKFASKLVVRRFYRQTGKVPGHGPRNCCCLMDIRGDLGQ